ncbi:MAG TPA: hypothetical protein VFL77_12805 [Solirubrobacterales bacterium]|nr:hypothetical protein [Solirubrobacterales bacterium]
MIPPSVRHGSVRRAATAAVLTLCALLPPAAVAQVQAGVKWRVVTESNTTVAPGDEVAFHVTIDNAGSIPTDGSEIRMTITLPPGMTGVSAEGSLPLSCSNPSGATVVICTGNQVFGPNEPGWDSELILKVQVDPSVPEGPRTASIRVEGGGAPVAEQTADPVQVTDAEPGFGVEAFDAQISTEGATYTQAAGHPELQSSEFDVNTHTDPNPAVGDIWPVEDLRDAVISLPPGLVGNLAAFSQCTSSQLTNGDFEPHPLCPPESQIGTIIARIGIMFRPIPLYNMVPPPGVPARFAFNVLGVVTVLDAGVRSSGAYGIDVTVKTVPQGLPVVGNSIYFWGVPGDPAHDHERVCQGSSYFGATCHALRPPIAFFRSPTSCAAAGRTSTRLRVDSWQHPGVFEEVTAPPHQSPGYPFPRQDWGVPTAGNGCGAVPFEPTFSASPTVAKADSPTGLSVEIALPRDCWQAMATVAEVESSLCQSDIKEAKLALPEGMTLNAAAAGGREGCTPAQIGLLTPVASAPVHFDEAPPSCPDSSKIGRVEIETPLLGRHDENGDPVTDPEGHPVLEPLKGSIYVAQQEDNPAGSLLVFYLVAEGSGVVIKQAGEVSLDPKTGRVTTTFPELPQTPFSNLAVQFFGGPRAILRAPPACGSYVADGIFTPWSGNAAVVRKSSILVSQGCGGGFDPKLRAGTENPLVRAYSPFNLQISREDGTEELDQLEVRLPPGVITSLRGRTYCPDAALAAIASKLGSGEAEEASPSCPASSRVGSVTFAVGAGVDPFFADSGRAYLAGPYGGAPASLAVVVPVVAGPFDLGSVLVRTAIHVNPSTAALTLDSGPLPSVLHGIPLDLRDLRVRYDKMLNPTSCAPMQIGSTIASTGGARVSPSVRFQVSGCDRLGFKPALSLRLDGPTHRSAHPALRAVLRPRRGDVNIASTTLVLPKTELLENTHIRAICTRARYAANGGGGAGCPKASIYGYARAWTPLLNQPLQGPVFLRSNEGERKLPDLVASLGGQIQVNLVGFIDSVHGRIRGRFKVVPDAPVSRVELRMRGGRRGLLANDTDLCRAEPHADVVFGGHDGAFEEARPLVEVRCGKRSRALMLNRGSAFAAECEGDECQVPPAAPDDPVPPTAAVEGPPNPPVRFPRHRKPKHRHKHHRDTGRGRR